MRRKRMMTIALAAMVLAACMMTVTDAAAGVRLTAAVRTPYVSVRIGNAPAFRPVVGRIRPMPARRRIYRVLKNDVRIARRLAWYSGLPAGDLITYRRFGYSWFEIGRWFRMPGPVVRAAMSVRTWNRYLHAAGRFEENHAGRARGRAEGGFGRR